MPVGKGQKNKRLLVGIVLDRSGSMGSIVDETISGVNEQFSALRDSDDAANTFVAFNTFGNKVTPVFKNDDGSAALVSVDEVDDITDADYRPSGMTAMRDGVNSMIGFLAAEANKADDVLVVVISDGMENCSTTPADQLASQVKELQDDGWNFTYIGANQDLTQVQADLGIHVGNMLQFDANAAGVVNMNTTVGTALRSYTTSRSVSLQSGTEGRTTTQALYASPDPDGTHDVDPVIISTSDGDSKTVS
jgi:glutaredoxin 2